MASSAALALALVSCGGGGGDSSSPAQASVVAPTNVAATVKENEVTLSWSPVANATAYHVYYSTDPSLTVGNYSVYAGGTWLQNVTSPLVIPNLGEGPFYYFWVTAVNGLTESPASSRVAAVTRYRFSGANDEFVRDEVTGLEWQRCSLGQSWSAATVSCNGTASTFNTAGATPYLTPDASGWRLPSLTELQSLVYCAYSNPATLPEFGVTYCGGNSPVIYQDVFPNTSPRAYHSSTPEPGYPGLYRLVGFSDGGITGGGGASLAVHIRLVRPTPP